MPDQTKLVRLLDRIDGRSYPAYRDLVGQWRIDDTVLCIDHVQGDPFAAPSRVRVQVPTSLEQSIIEHPDQRLAAEDWLLRRFAQGIRSRDRGSGKSGRIQVYRPGPEIIERSALKLLPDGTAEVRFSIGLPARGRRILGRQARGLLLDDIGDSANLIREPDTEDSLGRHIRSVIRQRHLRGQLATRGLVAFIGNQAILPRASGIDPRPLVDAVPFQSPASMEVTLDTPQGLVTGMGIPEGVTVIIGGGFHGKSTLLQAITSGHLDHVPGDGRETIVARNHTVKVRAEDGRRVQAVDISPFLSDLPGGRTTAPFSTEDASGSTSQAAAIIESVEAGARVLLIDEDTSATNLLVSDERMRMLIPPKWEPITPFVQRVRQMYQDWQVSTVMVVGGVGDYLGVADHVIAMEAWVPREVTQTAHDLVPPMPPAEPPLRPIQPRVIRKASLTPGKIRSRSARAVQYGDCEIDLTCVSQVIDRDHATTIAQAMRFLHDELVDGHRDLRTLLDALDAILDDEGIEALSPRRYPSGDLVRPRRHEIAAALNRLRTLRME